MSKEEPSTGTMLNVKDGNAKGLIWMIVISQAWASEQTIGLMLKSMILVVVRVVPGSWCGYKQIAVSCEVFVHVEILECTVVWIDSKWQPPHHITSHHITSRP